MAFLFIYKLLDTFGQDKLLKRFSQKKEEKSTRLGAEIGHFCQFVINDMFEVN